MPIVSSNTNLRCTRRAFLRTAGRSVAGAWLGLNAWQLFGQEPGQRPPRAPEYVKVLGPRGRVPVSLIIDDSTCLVNLNKFAVPQFAVAWRGTQRYKQPWRSWPDEIPDRFVRQFADWAAQQGVKGKYSVVPYPACVGRLDRLLPGWSLDELDASLELVRTRITPLFDIHPEMVTHTWVIDLKTGQPYPERSPRFMENWDWTAGRSADELAAYMAYALQILKNVGLPCEGITTPGGFGNQVLAELAQGTLQACRDVFRAEVPHYFRHAYDRGPQSVAPRVEYAADLDGPDPKCVVSIIACTGDWTGGWDCSGPGQPDRFITPDLSGGRLVEVIQRGEPAILLCHWTGIYFNGQLVGFKTLQEVVRRLHARYDHLVWMKLSEIARYWAARELTHIVADNRTLRFHAPFAAPQFTVRIARPLQAAPLFRTQGRMQALREVASPRALETGTWCRDAQSAVLCFDLPKGPSEVQLAPA